mmetsp:Transcript_83851/g.241084  ORF Transcript_83851/g.241084 Transcript_83851/m.241084 type:complete len:265 (-) Transcript_83851:68-862(-)
MLGLPRILPRPLVLAVPLRPIEVAAGRAKVPRPLGVLPCEQLLGLIHPPVRGIHVKLVVPEGCARAMATIVPARRDCLQLLQRDAAGILVAPRAPIVARRVRAAALQRQRVPDAGRGRGPSGRKRVVVVEVVAARDKTQLVVVARAILLARAIVAREASPHADALVVCETGSKIHPLLEELRRRSRLNLEAVDDGDVELARARSSRCVLRDDLVHQVPNHPIHVRKVDVPEGVLVQPTFTSSPVHVKLVDRNEHVGRGRVAWLG